MCLNVLVCVVYSLTVHCTDNCLQITTYISLPSDLQNKPGIIVTNFEYEFTKNFN